jgi:PTH1 family peptidyl-tRNA hydrolase
MSGLFRLFKKEITGLKSTGQIEYVVVCLGNPGTQYEKTRHNAGFIAGDTIAQKRGFRFERRRFESLTGECVIAGKKVLFLKPLTFMNRSGIAAAAAMRFYKLKTDRLIVLHDDVSLPPGRLRIRPKGSDGGHNGLKSIIQVTGSNDFIRVKIGVGDRKHPDYDLADWVLGMLKGEERALVEQAVERAEEALDLLVAGEVEMAMSRYNR